MGLSWRTTMEIRHRKTRLTCRMCYREGNLVKMSIMVNGEPVDALKMKDY